MNKKYKYVLFWIKSSRGTDRMTVYEYRNSKVTEDEIKDDLENWCLNFTAWHTPENYVSYGYKILRPETRDVLLKKWDRVCKQKNKIDKQYKELKAKLTPLPRK